MVAQEEALDSMIDSDDWSNHLSAQIPPPSHLERILGINALAGTEDARALLHAIISDIEGGDDVAPWVQAVQVARELPALEDAIAWFMIDCFCEIMFRPLIQSDALLSAISAEMEALERAHGLGEDEAFLLDEAPPEYRALSTRWDHRADALQSSMLRTYSEDAMALLLLRDRVRYDEMVEEGRLAIVTLRDEGEGGRNG